MPSVLKFLGIAVVVVVLGLQLPRTDDGAARAPPGFGCMVMPGMTVLDCETTKLSLDEIVLDGIERDQLRANEWLTCHSSFTRTRHSFVCRENRLRPGAIRAAFFI